MSKMVGFVSLRIFNDNQFCSVASRFCWVMRSQKRSVLLGYEISTMVGFGGLQDLDDGRFSVSVSFFIVTKFQRRSVLFRYEFSMIVGFGGLLHFNDGRFWWVTRSQRW